MAHEQINDVIYIAMTLTFIFYIVLVYLKSQSIFSMVTCCCLFKEHVVMLIKLFVICRTLIEDRKIVYKRLDEFFFFFEICKNRCKIYTIGCVLVCIINNNFFINR